VRPAPAPALRTAHRGHRTGALSALFSDWARSGERDLRLANDRNYYRGGSEQLWRVAAGKAPRLYTERDGWRPLQLWGMGIASQDLTGDGRPEVFITSQGDNKLQTLVGGDALPTYADIALERGVTAQRPYAGGDVLPSTAWHPEFGDVNNDGFVDLFVTKGNVEAQVDYAHRDPNNLLLGRRDGSSSRRRPRASSGSSGSWRCAVDLNLDGMLDLVVANRRENVKVWRNAGQGDAEQPGPRAAGWRYTSSNRPEPGRHRCVDRGEGRRPAHRPGTHRRRRHAGASWAGPLRARRSRRRSFASSGPTARPGRG
jgi:hypothetical protein